MWYYFENGTQHGPVDQANFDQLVNSGAILPATLVWREGQAEWLPWQSVSGGGTITPALITCSACGKPFPPDQVIELAGRNVCADCKPLVVQSLREGVAAPNAHTVWAEGKNIVTLDQSVFPPRCLKCNQPAGGSPLKRNLSWHPVFFYLLLFINVILYAVVALIVRKRMTVHIHLCERHRARRRNFIIAGWVGGVLSLILCVLGGAEHIPSLIGVATLLFVVTIFVGLLGANPARTKRIKDKRAWLTGSGPEFRASLPQWPG